MFFLWGCQIGLGSGRQGCHLALFVSRPRESDGEARLPAASASTVVDRSQPAEGQQLRPAPLHAPLADIEALRNPRRRAGPAGDTPSLSALVEQTPGRVTEGGGDIARSSIPRQPTHHASRHRHETPQRRLRCLPSDNDSLVGPLDHARTDQPTHRRQTLPGIRIAGEPGELPRPERRLASWPVRSPTLQHLDDAEPAADIPQPQVTASIRRPAPHERRRLDQREAAMHAAALDPRSMPGALGSLLCS